MNPQNQYDNQREYKVPKDAPLHKGEFIVFFSDDEDPEILFHSIIPEEAYQKAEEIGLTSNRKPTVIRIVNDEHQNLAQYLAMQI